MPDLRSLIAVLLLSGCNLPDPLEVIEPTTNCLGPFRSPQGVRLDGEAIRSNERLLKRLFQSPWADKEGNGHSKLMGSDKEFCMAFGGIHIRYMPEADIDCDGNAWNTGCNDEHGIKLAIDGGALLHELLHTYELEKFDWNTANHPDWEAKGFWALDLAYSSQYNMYVYPGYHFP